MAQARRIQGSGESLGANTTFGPFPITSKNLSIVASWTGTPTGTFALQCSFDNATWYAVPGAAAEFTATGNAQPAGGASSAVWNWQNVPGTVARLVYTATSGTGTFSATQAQQ